MAKQFNKLSTTATVALQSDIPEKATSVPKLAGTADIGWSDNYASQDHVHPGETEKTTLYTLAASYFPITYTIDDTSHTINNSSDIYFVEGSLNTVGLFDSATSIGICSFSTTTLKYIDGFEGVKFNGNDPVADTSPVLKATPEISVRDTKVLKVNDNDIVTFRGSDDYPMDMALASGKIIVGYGTSSQRTIQIPWDSNANNSLVYSSQISVNGTSQHMYHLGSDDDNSYTIGIRIKPSVIGLKTGNIITRLRFKTASNNAAQYSNSYAYICDYSSGVNIVAGKSDAFVWPGTGDTFVNITFSTGRVVLDATKTYNILLSQYGYQIGATFTDPATYCLNNIRARVVLNSGSNDFCYYGGNAYPVTSHQLYLDLMYIDNSINNVADALNTLNGKAFDLSTVDGIALCVGGLTTLFGGTISALPANNTLRGKSFDLSTLSGVAQCLSSLVTLFGGTVSALPSS